MIKNRLYYNQTLHNSKRDIGRNIYIKLDDEDYSNYIVKNYELIESEHYHLIGNDKKLNWVNLNIKNFGFNE